MTIKEKLEKIYLESAYSVENTNKTEFDITSVGSSVYGEIMYEGTNSLINKFSNHFNKDTVFYDLGSGLGKMVLHIGMQCGVKKSIRIEFSQERFNASKKIKDNYAKDFNNIYFKWGNILDCDLSDASVIYMDNTVFPEHINKKMYDKIPKGCLILYKRLYSSKFDGEGFEKEKQNIEEGLIKRTYHQSSLCWYMK